MKIERFTGKRRDDWPERLNEYVMDTTFKPWAWGRKDCVMWALGAVREMTGIDPAKGIRGTYRSEAKAHETLNVLGCKTVHEALIKCFGKSKPPAQAKRGDVVITTIDSTQFAGVCMGEYSVFAQEPLLSMPTLHVKRAWAV